jgi:hypothetical protein
VREILTDRSGRPLILCVSDRSNIHLGDVFTKRYELPRQTYDDVLNACPHGDPINPADIELTVAGIEWPKSKTSEVLPHGHTGAIQFTGGGLETVTAGCYLET